MRFFKSLPLSVVLVVAEFSSATLVPLSIQRAHGATAKHSRNLVRDLRVAFGEILVAQPNPPSQHVAYCGLRKPSGSLEVANGGDGGGDIHSTSTSASPSTSSTTSGSTVSRSTVPGSTTQGTSARPQPTAQTPVSSPWKIFQSFVRKRLILFPIFLTGASVQKGNNFFDGWQFTTGADKTNGKLCMLFHLYITSLNS